MFRWVMVSIACSLGQMLYGFSEGDIKEKIELYAKDYLKQNNGAGLAIAVIKNSFDKEEPYQKIFCFGYSRRAQKNSIKESTLFRLGSLSKTFTAALFASFLEEKKITLEESAAHYLPKTFVLPTYHKQFFNIADLLMNISALPNMPTIPMRHYYVSWVEIENYFRKYKLSQPPGKKYEKSDLGYALLGHIATRIAKMSYEQVLEERILKPLDLKDTYYSLPLSKMSRLATGYRGITVVGEHLLDREGSFFKTCRGMIGSIQDVKRWLAFFLKVEKSSLDPCLKHLYKSGYSFPDEFTREAPGWRIEPLSHRRALPTYHEEGIYQGFSHCMAFIPDTKTGVAILSNTEYDVKSLALAILELLNE